MNSFPWVILNDNNNPIAFDSTLSYENTMRLGSLAITGNDVDKEDEQEEPTQTQIVNFILACPDLTVRPADLSRQFGFSINDSSADLCGLLQVVGQGASFHFEDVKIIGDGNGGSRAVKSMVYKFPMGFDRKVRSAQRHDALQAWVKICIKALKVVTALGLIISILIVSVAILVALVAAFVTFLKGGGESRVIRTNVSRKMNSLISTIRQILFCYAMFGSTGSRNDTDHNHFFREAACDTLLVMNICYTSPRSIFFWWRAGRIRQLWQRRVSNHDVSRRTFRNSNESDDDVRNLISEDGIPNTAQSQLQQRNLISSLVVFLFGPTTRTGMSNEDKWRLRSAVIIIMTSNNGGNLRPISLEELAPFADNPPSSLDHACQVIAEGLSIVAYFNGVPYSKVVAASDPAIQDQEQSGSNALFQFPELISESYIGVRHDDPQIWSQTIEDTKQGWNNFFYKSNGAVPTSTTHQTCSKSTNTIPKYFCEQPKTFSSLSRNHFSFCSLAIMLNYFGVFWFSQSLESGGILEQNLGSFGHLLKVGLIPVLWFYARLFVAIPAGRLAHVIVCNKLCKQRNKKRQFLASQLPK